MNIKDFYTKQNSNLENNINVYVCGPTVYNHAHIGNVRPVITFDVLNRLHSLKGNFNYIHNITDVDDKIIKKAIELGISEKEVSEKYESEYISLLNTLNIKKPNLMPRVTDHIEGMIKFIELLISKGYAYESNGSVYFSVKKLENYGKFGNLSLEELIDDELSDDKKDNKDFAIWKSTSEGIQFESPWGKGRPGWHTECSYFIYEFFKDEGIHIHGGGIDLKFPHHVNEMAQYEAITGRPTENVWLYVGHINMGDEKMSKSLGNIILAKDFVEQYGANALRYLILSVQYLKPISINEDTITNSVNTINKIKSNIQKALLDIIETHESFDINGKISDKVVEVLEDDLDTPKALTIIFELIKKMNSVNEIERKVEILQSIIGSLQLLGIKFEIKFNELRDEIVDAKRNKNYEVLDKLREELIR